MNRRKLTRLDLQKMKESVKAKKFPEPKHTYKMVDGELPKLFVEIGKSTPGRI